MTELALERSDLGEPARHARAAALFEADAPALPPRLRESGGKLAAKLGAPGAIVGPYEVLRPLGAGAHGSVYLAAEREDPAKRVALKIPRPEVAERLVREAQILFTLEHPRIVRIERASVAGPVPYLALEHLPGGTLADRLREEPSPTPLVRVRAIGLAILEALEAAHARGVVHRDLKPANILFDAAGELKVADFGIGTVALARTGAPGEKPLLATLASHGATLGAGTPLYMAPEQEAGVPVDGRADLYALGKVLYEALTGHAPRTVRPASRVRADVPPEWDEFIFRMVEEWPDRRFSSAAEARSALEQLPIERSAIVIPKFAERRAYAEGLKDGRRAALVEAAKGKGVLATEEDRRARERAASEPAEVLRLEALDEETPARGAAAAASPAKPHEAPARPTPLPRAPSSQGIWNLAGGLGGIALGLASFAVLYARFLPGQPEGEAFSLALLGSTAICVAAASFVAALGWLVRRMLREPRGGPVVAGFAAVWIGLFGGVASLAAAGRPDRMVVRAVASGVVIGLGLMTMLAMAFLGRWTARRR